MEKFKSNGLVKYFPYEELACLYYLGNDYLKAKIIAARLFAKKFDKSGEPYFCHLLRVAARLEEPIEKTAAILHDTIEDTDVSAEDLLAMGFSQEIIDIVLLVTNEDIDTSELTEEERLEIYSRKIDSIIGSGNIHAIRLKEADMSDNFDEDRLSRLSIEQQLWFERKYMPQIKKLRNYLNKD